MTVLVTGASGLLGKHLAREMPGAAFTWHSVVQPWTRHLLDVTDPASVEHVFARTRPRVVVHMATVGDVDWCEAHYAMAERIVVGGARNVAAACRDRGSRLVYVSTNAVFGGDDPPYGPDSPRKPVNRYGAFRKRAEDVVMALDRWAVVRLFLLYGWEPPGARGNWASRIAGMLGRGETPRLVDDRRWQPTYAGHAAGALAGLVRREAAGSWHVMGEDRVTLYEFGRALAEAWGRDPTEVRAISSADLPPATAPRPVDASYDPAAERTVVLPGVREGLKAMYESGGA